MELQNIKREQWATEWDGGWFCYKCDCLVHWKTKAYMINGKPLCKKCAEKYAERGNKNAN